jgi:hypothetical protein
MSRCLVPTAFGNTPTGSTTVVEQRRVFVVPSEGIQGAPDRLGGRGGRDGDEGFSSPATKFDEHAPESQEVIDTE